MWLGLRLHICFKVVYRCPDGLCFVSVFSYSPSGEFRAHRPVVVFNRYGMTVPPKHGSDLDRLGKWFDSASSERLLGSSLPEANVDNVLILR
jgi:hypothetical protein